MKYQYRAVNPEGKIITGMVVSNDLRAATRQIQRQGLTALEIEHAVQGNRRGRRGRQPKSAEILVFLHQLTTLLESGVSLDEAVSSLAETAHHPFLAQAFEDMAALLRRGASFSEALRASKLNLPNYFYQLAEAGELTGKLAEALRDGVAQLEYEIHTASELRNALIYPSILILSGIGAVILIFTLVVPKFVNLLDKAQGQIPWVAYAVLGTGRFINEHMAILATVALGLAILIGFLFMQPAARQRGWDLLARLPLLGPWLTEADIGRWSAMLATLLENRIGLLHALELARQGVKIGPLRTSLAQVTKAVRGGTSLAQALEDSGTITATGHNLVRVGERSGELPRMLRSLATLYAESGRNRMKRFLLLLEPIAILVIGAVIGFIMTGIILAITSVNEIAL